MKRLLTSLILAAISTVATIASGVNPDQLRIYINPGHGAWGPGDRPLSVYREENGSMVLHTPNTAVGTTTPSYPDTLAFYESNTNLWKSFGVLEYLRQAGIPFDPTANQGDPSVIYASDNIADQTRVLASKRWGAALDMEQNIVMSRTKNGPWPHTGDGSSSGTTVCNRSLSEIARECQDNNFDVFVAIHSNAGTEGSNSNYHLLIYRGYNTPKARAGLTTTHQELSRRLGLDIWNHSYHLPYQQWTYDKDPYVSGDIDFYGSTDCGTSYGCYGYLGVLKMQVPGILTEGYFHTYQPSRHRAMNPDADRIEGILYARGIADYLGLPLTGKGNIYGIVRAEGETFQARYYKPNTSTNDQFMPVNGATVTLKDSEGRELSTYRTDNYYNGVFVFFDLEPGRYTIETTAEGYAYNSCSVEVVADRETLPEVFLSKTMSLSAPDSYDFEAKAGTAIPELDGYETKRAIARDRYLYLLAVNSLGQPKIVVVDHREGTLAVIPSLDGCNGDFSPVADIAVTTDGVLLAVNETQQYFNSAQGTPEYPVTIYRWANNADGCPTGTPSPWLTLPECQAISTASFLNTCTGSTFAYQGSSDDGKAYILARNNYYDLHPEEGGTSRGTRVIQLAVAGGKQSASLHDRLYDNAANPSDFYPGVFGEMMLHASTTPGNYIVSGTAPGHPAVEMRMPSSTNTAPARVGEMAGCVNDATNSLSFFPFLGKIYVAYPSGLKTGLADISDGLAAATEVSISGSAERILAGSVLAALPSQTDHTARMAIFEVVGSGVRLHLSQIVEETPGGHAESNSPEASQPSPVLKTTPFAYNLSIISGDRDEGYTLGYSLSEDAERAWLTLVDATTGLPLSEIELDGVAKGAHTVTLKPESMYPEAEYRWGIKVMGETSDMSGKVYHESPEIALKMVSNENRQTRGGVQIIEDPDSPLFGHIVTASGFGQGFRILTPEFCGVGERAYTWDGRFKDQFYGSPYNLTQRDGIIYASDFSDAFSNVYRFDPTDPSTDAGSLIPSTATLDKTTGIWTWNGNFVGCSSTAIAFNGHGDDTRFWIVAEDYAKPFALLRYEIGTRQDLSTSPVMVNSELTGARLLQSERVTLHPVDDGIFVAQANLTGTNTAARPAFVYVDNDGNILFSSAGMTDLHGCSGAMALNRDNSVMAIAVPMEGIRVYDVAWDAEGVPTFGYRLTVDSSTNYDEAVCQIAFDPAGNLYAYNESPARLLSGLNVYRLPAVSPVTETKAPSFATIIGPRKESTGIGMTTSAPTCRYYDLRGLEVYPGEMVPGIYIRVSEGKVEKIAVH